MRPEGLSRHDFVVYSRLSLPIISFETKSGPVEITPKGPIRIDTSIGVRAGVVAGLGVGCNPLWLFAEDLKAGRVVEILHDYRPAPLPIFAVTPARKFTPLRATSMADFLEAEFDTDPFVSSGLAQA